MEKKRMIPPNFSTHKYFENPPYLIDIEDYNLLFYWEDSEYIYNEIYKSFEQELKLKQCQKQKQN